MNTNSVICIMINKNKNNKATGSGIFVSVLGGLITFSLLLMNHLGILDLQLEFVLAPFLVFTLLIYGDKLLIFILMKLIVFTSLFLNRKETSSTLNQ